MIDAEKTRNDLYLNKKASFSYDVNLFSRLSELFDEIECRMKRDNRNSEIIEIDGIKSPVIHFHPAKEMDPSEAVLFVHGNPGSSQDWAELAATAARYMPAVAVDMPGFGRADKPHDFSYTVEGYAAHIEKIINYFGLKKVHLVLHDFGGPWGLAWAAMYPGKLASITLINTGMLPDYNWHYLAKIWRTPVLGELFQLMANKFSFRLLLKHGNRRGLAKDFVDRMFADFDRGTKRAVLKLYRATGQPGKRSEELAKYLPRDIPVLVIWGKCDPYIPVSYAYRQKEYFEKADVHILEDSGHWPFADNLPQTEKIFINFLKRI